MNPPLSPWMQVALASERLRLELRDLPVAPEVDRDALRAHLRSRYDLNSATPCESGPRLETSAFRPSSEDASRQKCHHPRFSPPRGG
ncbi:hypothetical protein [Vitiosangium sp. GDMCC 1.1324]|uniref:hypothetical protein n=1 Tax=Vitiosangium sp. (strain GDMCC 1.1324) TaxID=2138576 RepID=UPI000D364AEA|nr:hypothetical protein [Vitiosangium sp. GDMCC 1.1324]PTL84608.1 hypothetical protein DAT35_05945 [Vitiosangium sp. GDMCC 1.1324]